MPALAIQTLGRFALQIDGMERPVPPTAKARALLVYLAGHPQQEHSRDRIAELFWPESEPERSRARLSNAIWWIRKSLDGLPAEHYLDAKKATIAWREPVELDSAEFERLATSPTERERRAALACYNGEFLDGDDDEWPTAERERIGNLYESLLERMLAKASGDTEIAKALLRRNPYHEGAYRIAIDEALRTHRVPLARAFFARACAALGELGPAARAEFETRYPSLGVTRVAAQEHLPTPISTLIGRTAEIERTLFLLGSGRLVTVTGPGGVGKTRIALAAARHCAEALADGAFWVELGSVQQSDLILPAIATALRVTPRAKQSLSDAIIECYASKAALLALDNCEHLLQRCSEIVSSLLQAIPGLVVLATSREPLEILGEQVLLLEPMTEFDAIRLFRERAPASAAFLSTRGAHETLAAIVRRLDALPLAIELAAALAGTLSPTQILDSLELQHDLPATAKRTLPERHRSLHSLIEWSYDLLAPDEQRMFRSVGVFAGRFSSLDAAAICGDGESATLPLLTSLVRKSLVHVEQYRGVSHHYYAMLTTVREFAAEKAHDLNETAALQKAHQAHFSQFAHRMGEELRALHTEEAVAQLSAEWSNVRAMLASLFAGKGEQQAAMLVASIGRFWIESGQLAEGTLWIERARQIAADLPDKERAKLLYLAAQVAQSFGRYAQVQEIGDELLVLFRALDDRPGAAAALIALGNSAFHFGRVDEAMRAYADALQEYERLGDEYRAAVARMNLAAAMTDFACDFDESTRLLQISVAALRKLGAEINLGIALENLARASLHSGRLDDAIAQARESAAILQSLGNEGAAAARRVTVALAYLQQGQAPAAIEQLEAAFEPLVTARNPAYLANFFEACTACACARGAYEDAARLSGFAERYRSEHDVQDVPANRNWLRPRLSELQDHVSSERRAALEREGAELSPERAFALVSKLVEPPNEVGGSRAPA